MEYILFSKKVWVEVNLLIKVQIIQKSKIYKKVFFQKVCEMFRIFFKKCVYLTLYRLITFPYKPINERDPPCLLLHKVCVG